MGRSREIEATLAVEFRRSKPALKGFTCPILAETSIFPMN
jgi:hypothetical protein